MQKNYEKPGISAVETLGFETVCAGSGDVICPYVGGNRTSITPGNYNPCQGCFQEYYAGFMDIVSGMPGGNIAVNREQAIRQILASGNTCPGGLTAIS